MYFSLTPELREITPEEAAENQLAVGYIEKDELSEAILRFDFADTSAEDLVFLAAHDDDPFARYEAM